MLLGMYLLREKERSGLGGRMAALLMLWLIIPFSLRFGTEHHTMQAAHGYAVCFFVFYASICSGDARRRTQQLDIACAGMCLLAIVLGSALLLCAWTGEVFYSYENTQCFGVANGQLQHADHYNNTGMLALTCMLMCLVGLCRSKKKPASALYLLGVLMMALVVVLTQSRTSRYAMLAVLALGTWNALSEYLPLKKALLRQGAALACAAVVLAGGYELCSAITDAALAHYAGTPSPVAEAIVPSALAEDAKETAASDAPQALEARKAVDSTFSDRTNIWKNVFKLWKENPKHMLIGNGAARTRWLIAQNTIHEKTGVVATHNAYLHFAAEYGLIGFAILAVFMGSVVPAAVRVFFARGRRRMTGGCALCMLVIAILATGMMESQPLGANTPMNMMLYYALAILCAEGKALKQA